MAQNSQVFVSGLHGQGAHPCVPVGRRHGGSRGVGGQGRECWGRTGKGQRAVEGGTWPKAGFQTLCFAVCWAARRSHHGFWRPCLEAAQRASSPVLALPGVGVAALLASRCWLWAAWGLIHVCYKGAWESSSIPPHFHFVQITGGPTRQHGEATILCAPLNGRANEPGGFFVTFLPQAVTVSFSPW